MMLDVDLRSNRIPIPLDVYIPKSLQPFEHRSSRSSIPICQDAVDRLLSANSQLRLSQSLQSELNARKSRLYELSQISKNQGAIDGFPGLMPHQASGARWMHSSGRCILSDSQGMGKTITSLAAASLVGGSAVVICGNTKRQDWVDHANAWTDLKPSLVSSAAKFIRPVRGQIHVIGYETARRIKGSALSGDVLIIDEAHKFRNRDAEITRSIFRICRRFQSLFLLTATPVVNGPDDLWSLLHMIDKERFSSYWDFVARFLDLKFEYFGVKVGGIRDDEKSSYLNLVNEYMLRRDKDLSKLPRLVRKIVKFPLSGDHESLYSQMSKSSSAEFRGKLVEAVEVVAQITRLRQLSIDPALLWDDYSGTSKFDALVELFRVDKSPSVVFSMFSEVAMKATKRIEQIGLTTACITGQVSHQSRQDILRDFYRNKIQVLSITHGTGGEGLNLVAARRVIFMDLNWHPAGNEQARDRIFRFGQTAQEVEIIYIHSINTIEDHILEILKTKGKVTISRLAERLGRKIDAGTILH